ncbi:codanin-1 [Pelodytes ibericus]
MAAALERLLREEVSVSEVIHWVSCTGQERPVDSSLSLLSSIQKDFVPFLLNFLREQTSQILSHGPSTPAKTSNSTAVARSSSTGHQQTDPEKRPANGQRGSRVQLFAQTPNTSRTSDACFSSFASISSDSSFQTRSNYSGKSLLQTSPNFNCSPMAYHHEKRSAQKPNLGNFLVLTPEGQPPRRGRKKNNVTGRQVLKDYGRKSNEEDIQGDTGNASRNKQGSMNSISSPTNTSHININNLEEFPPMNAASGSASLSKPSRRINPTPVDDGRSLSKSRICFTSTPISECNIRHHPIGTEAFTSSPEGSFNISSAQSLRVERENLRKEKIKLLQQASSSSPGLLEPVTPTKHNYSRKPSITADSLTSSADVTKVSGRKQLEILAELYSACITGNLVPNIFLEFFFILQLLTLRGLASAADVECDSSITRRDTVERQYFQSVHNCVFFAVQVLGLQFAVISRLDRGTLKLLAENERVAAFYPPLQERLLKAYEASTAKVSLLCRPTIQSVSFQPETDNRSNFPSDRSFHIFKKQRDIFYEVLREWEDHHEKTDWNFDRCLGHKIRDMIYNLSVACNHSHFARLFQKQLLQMCKGPSGGAGGASTTDAPDQDVLNMLGSDNLNRLKRLQERFVAPQSVGGPCPPPSFPGYQEFFRDFIVSAGSHQFNQHLMDTLCQEIQELDDVSIVGHRPADGESDMDQQDEKVRFASILLSLRLLAKFLGFVTFLPYRTTEILTRELQESAVALRSQTLPMLDVLQLLQSSIRNHRTVLTVPWIVEYLSLVDHVAPFLVYYKQIFSLLLQLYRYRLILTDEEDTSFLNKLLILAVLGWLFQVPTVPEEFFFNTDSAEVDVPVSAVLVTQGLDSVPLVDQQLLYSCCPYLGELRKLLTSFVAGSSSKNGGFIRKITPTTAESLMPKQTLSQKTLQAELEQAFFHNQPPSLQRTVEFVAERIGSNCVKHIKATFVADLVKRAELILRDKVAEDSSTHGKLLDSVCAQLCEDGRRAVQKGKEYCKEKVPEALKVLLPEEISPWVLSSAEDIAVILATEKACTWLSSNISALIKREVKATFSCMVKSQTSGPSKDVHPTCLEGCEHRALRPSRLIMEMKDILCIAVGPSDEGEGVRYQQLKDLVKQLTQTLGCKKYMYPPAEHHLAKCSVELASMLVSDQIPVLDCPVSQAEGAHGLLAAKKEALCDLLASLLSVWQRDFTVPVPVHLLFCQKNVSSLAKVQPHKWDLFIFMLRSIVNRGLMRSEDVEEQVHHLKQFTGSSDFLSEVGRVYEAFRLENESSSAKDSPCNLLTQPIARVTAQS